MGKSLHKYKSAPYKKSEEFIRAEGTKAKQLIDNGQYQEALRILQPLLTIAENSGYDAELMKVRFFLGIALGRLGEFNEALTILELSKSSAQQFNDIAIEAKCLNSIAIIHDFLGNYSYAAELQMQSIGLKQKAGDIRGIANSLHQLGNTYCYMKNYHKGLEFYQRALEIKEPLGNLWSIASSVMGIGTCYENLGNLDLALEYNIKALKLKEHTPNLRSYAASLHNIASILVRQNKLDQAMEYALQSKAIKEQANDLYFLCTTLGLIGTIYNRNGQHQKALDIAQHLLSVACEINSDERICDAHKLFHETHAAIQNFEAAYKHYDVYFSIYTKLQNEDSRKHMEQLSTSFDVQNAQHKVEVEQLRSRALEQEVETKNKELTTLALSLAQKNETLNRLRHEIISIKNSDALLNNKEALGKLERNISSSISSAKGWSVFEQQFQSIHHNFIQQLTKQYPALSPMELRVCALLKINLTTKEIANLLCIETKSVEMYRYRIRKKLKLNPSINLSSYLLTI